MWGVIHGLLDLCRLADRALASTKLEVEAVMRGDRCTYEPCTLDSPLSFALQPVREFVCSQYDHPSPLVQL